MPRNADDPAQTHERDAAGGDLGANRFVINAQDRCELGNAEELRLLHVVCIAIACHGALAAPLDAAVARAVLGLQHR